MSLDSAEGWRGGAWVLAGAVAVYAVMALDGQLYWHDVRYLYATAHYSLGELIAGQWNPQYGETIDAASSGAFYLVKLSWLALLECVWALRAPEDGGVEIAMTLSLLAMASAAGLLALVLHRLGDEDRDAPRWLPAIAAALLLVSPTLPYLGGKLLAETIALPLALGALLLALDLGRMRGPVLWLNALAAACLHVAAVSARPNVGILLPACFVARAILARESRERIRALGWAAAFLALQILAHVAVFSVSGNGWAGFEGYSREFASGHRNPLVSVLGTIAAGGALWLLAGLAAASPRRRSVRFHALWLAFALIPTLAVVGLYQVEARYLIAPLAPLAALAALGAGQLVSATRARAALATAIALGVVVVDGLALSVLPFEVDRRALAALMDGPELDAPGAALLVPWAYSDFHYLRTTAPERAVYFVHVPRIDGRLRPYTPEWQERIVGWYGDHVLWGPEDLTPLLRAGPVYYLSWGVHPPLERWARRLRKLGLGAAADAVRRLGGIEHGDQSWVVAVPGLERQPVRESDFYLLERVSSTSEQ